MMVDHRLQTMQQEKTRHTIDLSGVSLGLRQSTCMPVARGLLQRQCSCGGTPGLDDVCSECRAKGLGLQRQATNQATISPVLPIIHEVLRSPGQPLDPATRTFMESRVGHDFSRVRVHNDAQAADSAAVVNAEAYTVGRDIVFGAGRFAPHTTSGQRLLAHELTHVVQQSVARPLPTKDGFDKFTQTKRHGELHRETVPMLHSDKGMQCFTASSPLTIAGLGSIEDVADALLAQVPVTQDPLLAELIQARADFAATDTLLLPASAVQELADIARSAAAELPAWIPAPQLPAPTTTSGTFAMAALDPRIVIGIVIVIIVILIILILLSLWAYERLKEMWQAVKHLYEQSTQPSEETDADQPSEESDTGEVPETGDTGVADFCELPGKAPNANDCGQGSCPAAPTFCTPCQSEEGAKLWRDNFSATALEAIGGYVSDRVVPVWNTYLSGGTSGKQNYSERLGQDFAKSETTLDAAGFLVDALEDSLKDDPPPTGFLSESDVGDRIGYLYGEGGELEKPASGNVMDFDDPASIPGNLAGGAGTEQSTCSAGAHPSTQKDERRAQMKASITRIDAGFVEVTPVITFTIRDTVDLCPGNCGGKLEQGATIPFSRFEATGISGDVPFEVTYQVFPDPFELELPETEGEPDEHRVHEGDTAQIPE